MSDKRTQWEGYFEVYREKARERGIEPVEVLDLEWRDGRATAERRVLPHLPPDAEVLEIGCGIGRVSRFVAPACARLVCTDILDDALDEARSNLAGFDRASFERTNGYDLSDFDDESFDFVYSFTTFFHFDWEVVVAYFLEIKRVLRPGGMCVLEFKKWIGDGDVDQLLEKVERVGGVAAYEAQLDKWRYVSTEMLRVLCEALGLTVVDPDVTHYGFRKPVVGTPRPASSDSGSDA